MCNDKQLITQSIKSELASDTLLVSIDIIQQYDGAGNHSWHWLALIEMMISQTRNGLQHCLRNNGLWVHPHFWLWCKKQRKQAYKKPKPKCIAKMFIPNKLEPNNDFSALVSASVRTMQIFWKMLHIKCYIRTGFHRLYCLHLHFKYMTVWLCIHTDTNIN